MHIVLSRIVYDMTLVSSTLDPDHYQEPSWHLVEDVLMRGSSYQLILLDVVRISGFSFHHYMHLVFAEMLKSIRSVCYDQAGTTLSFTDLVEREIIKGANDCEKSKLLLIEWPLESKFVRTCSQANM
jgi:E3 ubiquitin-protein ligase UBR1